MRKISGRFGAVAGITALMGMLLAAAIAAPAQNISVLYSFTGGTDGAEPLAGVIADSAGNLYGTTWRGGAYAYGTVYELPTTGGEKVLYSFTGGSDGNGPRGGLLETLLGIFTAQPSWAALSTARALPVVGWFFR